MTVKGPNGEGNHVTYSTALTDEEGGRKGRRVMRGRSGKGYFVKHCNSRNFPLKGLSVFRTSLCGDSTEVRVR